MLTPIDIQNHTLKTAVRGYSKKETDEFLDQILAGYEELFKENHDLKEKVSSLSEGIQYYKQMETTLQKALVLAEKTSAETQDAAKSTADALLSEANTKAESIVKEAKSEAESLRKETEAYSEITKAKANTELSETRNHVRKLVQSYENYRLQFKKLAESQIEMLESENYSIFAPELDEMLANAPDADEAAEAENDILSLDDRFVTPLAVLEEEDVDDDTENQESPVSEMAEETTTVEYNDEPEMDDVEEEDTIGADAIIEDTDVLVDEDQDEVDAEIDAITENLKLNFDKMTSDIEDEEEDSSDESDEAVLEDEDILALHDHAEPEDKAAAKSDSNRQTPRLDDFDEDDEIKSVEPEDLDTESPFTFIDPE